jgi:hypothetical protein
MAGKTSTPPSAAVRSHLRQRDERVDVAVRAIAVGGLHHDVVRLARFRRPRQQIVAAARSPENRMLQLVRAVCALAAPRIWPARLIRHDQHG